MVEKADNVSEDDLMMEALEAGAEDMTAEDGFYEIITEPGDFTAVREALESKGYEFVEAEISMIPTTTTKLTDPRQIEQMKKLIDNLEEMDDVQNVYHNWEQDEEEEE